MTFTCSRKLDNKRGDQFTAKECSHSEPNCEPARRSTYFLMETKYRTKLEQKYFMYGAQYKCVINTIHVDLIIKIFTS